VFHTRSIVKFRFLYDAILFANVHPQSGAKKMGDDVISTKIESSISAAVLDSQNHYNIITRDILWIDLKRLIRIWLFKPEIPTFIWFHVDTRPACITYVDLLIFLSLNIHNCWTLAVFCIYLRITTVLKQPAHNTIIWLRINNYLYKVRGVQYRRTI